MPSGTFRREDVRFQPRNACVGCRLATPLGRRIALAEERMRARYRESVCLAQLVKPGEVKRYEFKSFPFFSRRLEKGRRLRLVSYSPNSKDWEKNYNSGGELAAETAKDARTAHARLYQDAEHASYLEVPVISATGLR